MRDAIVQLCCCAFYKAFLSDPIGSSQELTCRATIAIVGSASSRQLLFHVHLISLKREYAGCMISYDPMFGQWPVCLLRVILWSHLGQFLQVTWRSCCNVSGTSCKLLDQDVTTYQGRLASCLTKMLQRIRNALQVTYRRFYNLAVQRSRNVLEDTWRRRLASYLEKMLQRIRNVLKDSWRRCYNESGTSWKLLEEDVTTCQERVGS